MIGHPMFHEFTNPMPLITPLGPGYAIYVRDGGTYENDIWCVALEDGGRLLHFRTDQISVWKNGTFDIKADGKQDPDAEIPAKELLESMERINNKFSNVLRKLADTEREAQ